MTLARPPLGGADGADLTRVTPILEWREQLQIKHAQVVAAESALAVFEQEYVGRCKQLAAMQSELEAESQRYGIAIQGAQLACLASGFRAQARRQKEELQLAALQIDEFSPS